MDLERTSKLAEWEWVGLSSRTNLADGQARQDQGPAQLEIVRRLPNLYLQARQKDQFSLQRDFAALFFGVAGQPAYERCKGPLYHYSASISLEVVANYLRTAGKSVALMHPTFGVIADMLRRHGVPLVALEEDQLLSPQKMVAECRSDAIFLISPNNPTGFCFSATQFAELANECRRRRKVLILDFCLRFFGSATQYDQYDILLSSGTEFIAVEDTGKTLPTLDLKISPLLASDSVFPTLEGITHDLLLNVSPFTFALLTEYLAIERRNSSTLTSAKIATRNREELRQALVGTPLRFTGSPEANLAWLELPDQWDSFEFCKWLIQNQQMSVLPGTLFYWNEPQRGRAFVRISLSHPEVFFRREVLRFRDAVLDYAKTPEARVDV